MWKLIGSVCVLLAACATGGGGLGREAGNPGLARFAAEDLEPAFPAAKNPQLPSADRIARAIASELGQLASADVKLCVASDGHVQAVELVRGSSLAAFDEAVLHDTAEWQFPGFLGSRSLASHLRTCAVATIAYRPHR